MDSESLAVGDYALRGAEWIRLLTRSGLSFTLRVTSLRSPYHSITLVIPDAHQGFCFRRGKPTPGLTEVLEKASGQGAYHEWESPLVSGLNLVVETPKRWTGVNSKEEILCLPKG